MNNNPLYECTHEENHITVYDEGAGIVRMQFWYEDEDGSNGGGGGFTITVADLTAIARIAQ